MIDKETLPEPDGAPECARNAAPEAHALVLAWSRDETWRLGQALIVPPHSAGRVFIWGRGPTDDDDTRRICLQEHRLWRTAQTTPLASASISRKQLEIRASGQGGIAVRNIGRCPLLRNGVQVSQADFHAGDTLQLGKQLLFIVARRAATVGGEYPRYPDFEFGDADAHGIVGESAAAWRLRGQVAFFAPQKGHLLISGPSGAGKELVAQAIHALSERRQRRMVARNAATLPETLIDAELFGNCKNYPNPGMADRPGLIGEASGSSLFLDEIAELPQGSQAHLLRVLDRGEYQRLGEATCRRADLRVIAATNRDTSVLKPDVLARLRLRIVVPDLNERKEDVPLLVRHILGIGKEDGQPFLPLSGMRALLERRYECNVRELELVVRNQMAPPDLRLGDATEFPPQGARRGVSMISESDPSHHDVALTPHKIQRCLDDNNGVLELTWRALGLSNRFALLRLVKKYQLEVRRRHGQTQLRRNNAR
ncbi:MAG TPA: sigma 54-interacting transcriptional regulator [Polyangiaceae bacterium]|nr:sigma 54-interacting transcriptional regulator [Polyangiaceae bacterium]